MKLKLNITENFKDDGEEHRAFQQEFESLAAAREFVIGFKSEDDATQLEIQSIESMTVEAGDDFELLGEIMTHRAWERLHQWLNNQL